MFSFKKLGLLSVATALLISFSNPAEASHGSRTEKCCAKKEIICRTTAVQQSENVINTFALKFAAAVREQNSGARELLVAELFQYLATPFSLEVQFNGVSEVTITTYQQLLDYINSLSGEFPIFTNMIGNLSVRNYEKDSCGCRALTFDALQYFVVSTVGGVNSFLSPSIDSVSLIETSCDIFKIQNIRVNIINIVPMCCNIIP